MRLLVVILLAYWIVLTERLTAEGLIVGCLISLGVEFFYKYLKVNDRENKSILIKNPKLSILYIAELLKEIVISNIHVAKIVLSPNLRISPRVIKLKTGIKSDFNRAIFANSMTLTPGTITISMQKDELLIHCLEDKSTGEVQDSKLEKIIMKSEE
jgi:multicomponent Na+:H+ antiporter subunit E